MFKDLLALIGVLITILAVLPYISSALKGKTKPHFITWLIWTILATTGAILQVIGGGGWGSAVLGVTAMSNAVILCLSLKHIKNVVTKLDIFVLLLAGLSVIMWRLSNNSNVAEILVTTAFVLGYAPTYMKAYKSPQTEKVSLYFWSAIKQIVGILALAKYNLLTMLLPVALVLANVGLIWILRFREG